VDFVSSNWRDIVNVVGVIASLAGLGWTIRLAWQAKTAAEQARDAAREARDHVLRFDLIAALSAAIAALDEIKGLHRIGAWEMALIRYGTSVNC